MTRVALPRPEICRGAPNTELLLRLWTNPEQRLAVLYRAAVLRKYLDDFACHVRLDLIHQLHRFYDAQDLARLNSRAFGDKSICARARRCVISSHNRRLN